MGRPPPGREAGQSREPGEPREHAVGFGREESGSAGFFAGNGATSQRFSCQFRPCPISGCHAFEAGREPGPSWFAAIAQLVEHVIRNDGVGGSNPSCGTSKINHSSQMVGPSTFLI